MKGGYISTYINNHGDELIETFVEFEVHRCVTSFEVEKKPSVAEIEMRQVSILLKMLKHFRIQDLQDDKNKSQLLSSTAVMLRKMTGTFEGKTYGAMRGTEIFFFVCWPTDDHRNKRETYKRMKQFKGDYRIHSASVHHGEFT